MAISDIITVAPKRNKFNLSHSRKSTIQDFGILYPILCQPVIPGDVWRHSHQNFLQFMPMASAVLHDFHVKTYFFFVANRDIYDDWDDFISKNPNQYQTPPVQPYMQFRDLFNRGTGHEYTAPGSLADYLGIPVFKAGTATYASWDTSTDFKINTLPFRAYQKIWYDYFRDEQVLSSVAEECSTVGGGEAVADLPKLCALRSKCWNKNPLTTSIAARTLHGYVPSLSGTFTIEDFRNASALTRFHERMARSGQRPMEFTYSSFGVKPEAYRLGMPELLSASDSHVIMGNVYASDRSAASPTSGTSQGYSVATARSSSVAGGFKYRAKDHGWIIGLMCLEPANVYSQGLPHMFRVLDNMDYFWPDFESLGDQAIENSEIHFTQVPATDSGQNALNKAVHSYAPRYHDLKFIPSTIHGLFKDSSYNTYTDARFPATLPARTTGAYAYINGADTGRVCTDPNNLKRIFSMTSGEPIAIFDIYHKIDALRPMHYNSVPRI